MEHDLTDDRLRQLLRQAVRAGQDASGGIQTFGPETSEGLQRILAKARGESPMGHPAGCLPGLSPPTTRPAARWTPSSWSLHWRGWAALAACVLVILASGAYVGRGVIVRIWSSSGKVTEIRVRDGERIEIVGEEGTPRVPAPLHESQASGQEWIIDDGDPGYKEEGNWQRGTAPGGYSSDYRYNERGGTTARWTFSVPPGDYEVFATWVPHPNRVASLAYFIHDGQQEKAAIVVDQRSSPEESASPHIPWRSLGVFSVSSGELSVQVDARVTRVDLNKSSGNAICADAIRIRRLAP